MYLIGLLQEAKFLTTLSCDKPYSCNLKDLREVLKLMFSNISVVGVLCVLSTLAVCLCTFDLFLSHIFAKIKLLQCL